MSFSYDPATDPGRVRLLIADTEELKADNTRAYIFDDAEISAFLDLKSGSVYRAAAQALRSIAASRIRLEQKIQLLDVSMDTKGLAAELRAQAKELDQQDSEDGAFAIAEVVSGGFAEQERLRKEAQRKGTW